MDNTAHNDKRIRCEGPLKDISRSNIVSDPNVIANASESADAHKDDLPDTRKEDLHLVHKRSVAEKPDASKCFAVDIDDIALSRDLARIYRLSKPYMHAKTENLVDDSLLRAVFKEINDNLIFSRKETDIYKVLQTGDLLNLSGLGSDERKRLQNLLHLRDAIYSRNFRAFISRITGCGPLSGHKKDLAVNLYQKGCHLLTHDDVISSRRISFIIYLTPPDEEWLPEYGGAIRLFSTTKPGFPETYPCLTIPPQWNQICFFTVQPGYSFHDVQEVFVDKNRVSILGWFHTLQKEDMADSEEVALLEKCSTLLDAPEVQIAKSTLECLENDEMDELEIPKTEWKKYTRLEPTDRYLSSDSLNKQQQESNMVLKDPTEYVLWEEDRLFLSKYIREELLHPENIKTLQNSFAEFSFVNIAGFLNDEYASKLFLTLEDENSLLLSEANAAEEEHRAPAELFRHWQTARPSHKHRHLFQSAANSVLPVSLFEHPAFLAWLEQITATKIAAGSAIGRAFRSGMDFTLATGSQSKDSSVEGTLCLSREEVFADEELGGYEAYMLPDESNGAVNDEDAAAVYHDTGDSGAVLSNAARWNYLTIVLRDEGLLKFVKYISKRAERCRFDVSAQYKLDQ